MNLSLTTRTIVAILLFSKVMGRLFNVNEVFMDIDVDLYYAYGSIILLVEPVIVIIIQTT